MVRRSSTTLSLSLLGILGLLGYAVLEKFFLLAQFYMFHLLQHHTELRIPEELQKKILTVLTAELNIYCSAGATVLDIHLFFYFDGKIT